MNLDVSPERIKRASAAVTVVHLIVTALAVAGGDAVRSAAAALFTVIFLAGCVVFLIGFVRAAGRSREEEVPVGGVFFLTGGSVPAPDRRWLYICVGTQIIVGLVGAFAAPFTALAFGTLVPLFGAGTIALFGATFGVFDTDGH